MSLFYGLERNWLQITKNMWFKVIYIIYIHMSRLKKNSTQTKKRHMYMFTLSEKIIIGGQKRPNCWALTNSVTHIPPSFINVLKVLSHNKAHRRLKGLYDGIWERLLCEMNHLWLEEGIDANNSGCCMVHGFSAAPDAGARLSGPTPGTAMDLSQIKACTNHTNVQLARTISITFCWHSCSVCVCVSILNVRCLSGLQTGSLPYFKCSTSLSLCLIDLCQYNTSMF